MKKFTFLFVLFFCAKMAFGQWEAIGTLESRTVYDIFESNGSIYFNSCDGTGIYKSTDNGVTWNKKIYFEVFGDNYCPYYFKSYNFGDTLLFCFDIAVFRSFDNGETWSYTILPRTSNDFFMIDNKLYSLYEPSYKQYYSVDYGLNWIVDSTSAFVNKNIKNSFVFQDKVYFFEYTMPGNSLYKINNEDSITKMLDFTSENYYVATNHDRITILHYQMMSGAFITSSNGGQTWQNHPISPSNNLYAYEFWYNGDTLFQKYNDKIYTTLDAGISWQTYNFDLNYEIIGKPLISNGYQFFSSQNNSIFRNPIGSYLNWTNLGPSFTAHYVTLLRKFGNTIIYKFDMSMVPVLKNLDSDSITFLRLPPLYDNNVFLSEAECSNAIFVHTSQSPYCFKSLDTAKTWHPVSFPDNINISYLNNDLLCYDNDTLYRLFNEMQTVKIFYSIDLGNTWHQMFDDYVGSSNEFSSNEVFFKNKEFLYWGSKNVTSSHWQSARFKIENNIIANWDTLPPAWNAYINKVGNTLFKIDNSTWGEHRLYKSDDNGSTWITCGYNLPNISSDPLFFGNDSVMFFAQYNKIFASMDKGFNWFLINDNLLNEEIVSFMISHDSLYAYVRHDKIYSRNIYDLNATRISGYVFEDTNNNGILDNNEQKIPRITIGTTTGIHSMTNDYGDYNLFTSGIYNNDTLRMISPPLYSMIQPDYYIINETDSNKTFSIYRTPGISDLRVDITAKTQPRPGFNYYINIIVQNDGTVAKNASLDFEYDDRFILINSSFTPTMAVNNILSWSFSSFYPLQSLSIWLTFRLNQTVPLGETVNFKGTISPIIDDTTMENNTDSISDIVVGSFDPNEKTINRAIYLSPQQVLNKSEMIYTVRFQNTGTWYAENVSILDTLHRNLDLSTFRVISASHDYNFDFSGNGIVRFNFPNINLPDSNMNEAASHGFIKYAIRLNNNIPLNDSITNTAHIYFDFNEAIVTNTALNIVKIDAAINETNQNFNVLVYPNPAKMLLNIRFEEANSYQLAMYSMDGRLVINEKATNAQHAINVASLNKGIYLLKISDENRSKVVKVVIQ
ncbi:MAG: T9SS type A sorting domain-containing protein [Bacteroidales bacterium]|nr:T9SS type A sorting domain-containing protein [Bacteroidales bacterium]